MPRVHVTETRSRDLAQSFVDQIDDLKTIIE